MPPRHWGHARAPVTFRHCVHRSSDFGYFAFFPARPFQLWATQGVTPNLMRGIYMWRGWGRQTFSHMNALNFALFPKFCSYPNILPRLRYPHWTLILGSRIVQLGAICSTWWESLQLQSRRVLTPLSRLPTSISKIWTENNVSSCAKLSLHYLSSNLNSPISTKI